MKPGPVVYTPHEDEPVSRAGTAAGVAFLLGFLVACLMCLLMIAGVQ